MRWVCHAYLEARAAGASSEAALAEAVTASEAAHTAQIQAWGSLDDYIQAHGAFGQESHSWAHGR